MEASSLTQGQTLGLALRLLLRRGRMDYRSRVARDIEQNPTEWLPWVMETQILSQWTVVLHETDLGSQHICNSCVAWTICGTPGNQRRTVLVLWMPLRNLFLMLNWLVQNEYRGKCLVLWQINMPCFADTHEGPAPSWVKKQKGWTWGNRVEGKWVWEERWWGMWLDVK